MAASWYSVRSSRRKTAPAQSGPRSNETRKGRSSPVAKPPTMTGSSSILTWWVAEVDLLRHSGRNVLLGREILAGRNVPADEFAAEEMRRALSGRAGYATPPRETAIVGQKSDVAGVLGRVTRPVMAGVVAVGPVLAGAGRRLRRFPKDGRREWTGELHVLAPVVRHASIGWSDCPPTVNRRCRGDARRGRARSPARRPRLGPPSGSRPAGPGVGRPRP